MRVYTAVDRSTLLHEDETLDGGDVLPGFSLSIRDWFAEAERTGPRRAVETKSLRIRRGRFTLKGVVCEDDPEEDPTAQGCRSADEDRAGRTALTPGHDPRAPSPRTSPRGPSNDRETRHDQNSHHSRLDAPGGRSPCS